MSSKSTCTVVVPTYNRATLTGQTLAALTRQSLSRDRFDVVVVDDGSSDNTADVVAAYRTQLNVRYFFQPDEGFRAAAARNVGVGHAQGDVCVFIDAGVLASTGCLAAHLASHDESDEPVAVCGYVYGLQPLLEVNDRISAVLDVTDVDRSIERMRGDEQLLDVREQFYAHYTEQIHDLPAPWQLYWSGNASAPTSLIREVGAFDEAFRSWGGEDIDLGYRLYCARARFVVNRSASAVHCPHPRDFAGDVARVGENYRYMQRKYATAAVRLLAELPSRAFFEFNDILLGRTSLDDLRAQASERSRVSSGE